MNSSAGKEPSSPASNEIGGGGLTFSRVGRRQRHRALALLLTGVATDHSPAVDPFLGFADGLRLSLDDLWAACIGNEPQAAMLIVPAAGRTATAFISPVAGPDQAEACAGLAGAACQAMDPKCVRLVQLLLDPQQQEEACALKKAGFNVLAELLYMERAVDQRPARLDLGASIRCVNWSKANRSYFSNAILASYQDTLDCPGLVGLRHIDDIIAGHMATGRFKEELWFSWHTNDEPVAVMLLNLVHGGQVIELVYLGVGRNWRGRGIGRKLLEYGLSVAPRHGAANMILAVDRVNKPALRLYRTLRFTTTARRMAMIYPLPEPCA